MRRRRHRYGMFILDRPDARAILAKMNQKKWRPKFSLIELFAGIGILAWTLNMLYVTFYKWPGTY